MIQRLLLFSIFSSLLFINSAKAQNTDFENACLVTVKGDSLTGKIIFKNDASITSGVSFNGPDNHPVTFKPKEIRNLILTDYNIQYESVTLKTAKDTICILACLMVKGSASLYQSNFSPEKLGLGEGEDPFYILKTSKGTLPLLYNPYYSEKDNNRFRGLLIFGLNNCEAVIKQIGKVHYNAAEISKIIIAYNKYMDPKYKDSIIIKKKQAVPAKVSHQFVIGAVVASKVQQGKSYNHYDGLTDYSHGKGFTVGYSLRALYPSISKRILTDFDFGIVYAKYQTDLNNYKDHYNYLKGRLKILTGFILSETEVKPIIQFGPSVEISQKFPVAFPFLDAGLGVQCGKFYIGSIAEIPFVTTNGGFYSLNLKYTFAQSRNSKR